ncbi:suppressor of mec-8 and unc-52 protein homolog 2-like [Humulus lupulus]|uniref:suppressor of mec-8 and unc-52 protein homolog 2-like n=1 Tax=Humulus lupulus TaxID=3486 RepID=UPI002B4006F8|nr:suppressor of mec-8 and unc-52 protein homolog 2-like [Humulus lupulus]
MFSKQCDVEHTHLVKRLDYDLLNKIQSEIDKKPDSGEESDGKQPRASKEDQQLLFRTATAKSVYQWIVKPQTAIKSNEMFLPGRMAFIFNMENGYSHDIPTMVHRSRADCPQPEEMVTVSVDGSVLDRISKIMSYLRLGSFGKVLKNKNKDRDVKGNNCKQLELEKLVDILKHAHDLLSTDLSIDSFSLMMNEMQENISLVSFSSRLASQV